MPDDVKKPIMLYQTDRGLVALRDVFVCIISPNHYKPEDADNLDLLLDQAYRNGIVVGINYALDKVKNRSTD